MAKIMDKKTIYQEIKNNPKNIRFDTMCRIVEMFGFQFKGGKGSHRIYKKEGVRELLNFQNFNGKAKAYQVKQFVKIIQKYNLLEE